jgi:hypothetical protein
MTAHRVNASKPMNENGHKPCAWSRVATLGGLGLMLGWLGTSTPAQLRVICWGSSFSGITNVPPSLTNVRAIAAGYNHCLALVSNGTVVAWGDNSANQTNLHPSLTNITAIAAGQYHNLALRSNGTVFAWGGYNNNGELNVPAGLVGVRAIAAGGSHNLALQTNGTVVAWGRNFSGQTNVPAGLTGVAFITAGDTHSMALRSNGTVVAWGDNDSSQTNTPASLTNAALVAAGYHHNLAVRSNGAIVAWEQDVYGETTVPPGLSNVVAISAGYFFSAAVRSNGTVVAWGQNFSGQTNVPPGLTNVLAIAAGSDHVMALTPSPICAPGFPDHFECRQTLTGTNLTFTISNVGSTREASEPQHDPVPSSNSLWFTWTAPTAGGFVFKTEAPTGGDYFKPIVAVYTGTSLATLVKQAANSTASNESGGDPVARVAFTASAGQNYHIAVDGLGEGTLTNTLTLAAPPPNDLFSNAVSLGGIFHSNSGVFLGASRESGEPSHNAAALGQTLWWQWTAPTNAPNPLSVRLLADAVSFPPGLGVYTGNSVAALAAVPLTTKTNGMTIDAIFNATPGNSYRIALAGTASDAESAAALIGSFHFRLNTRVLALTITNLTTSTNGSGAVSFQAATLVQNLGPVTSGPLRVSLNSISGLSTTRALSVPPASTITNLLITNVAPALLPGQSVLVAIAGTAPAPDPEDASTPIAYGVYADLQEQPAPNKWFSVDQTLVTYDKWPGIGEIFGPGGGVIRLDPGYGAGATFTSVSNVHIIGTTSLPEGRTTNYYGRATFADATTQDFTNTTWLASPFNIATNGVFTAGSVTSNTLVSLGAIYSFAGIISYAFTNITVVNLPPPTITNLFLTGNAGVVFSLLGVPGRRQVIEAATNLTAPVFWLPVLTNTPANGTFTVTNYSRTNFPMRFYRAREN